MTTTTGSYGAGRTGRALAGVVVGLILAAVLFARAPGIVGRWTSGLSGAAGEATFTLMVFGPLLMLALVGGALTGVRAASLGVRAIGSVRRGAALGLTGLLLAVALAGVAGTVVRAPGSRGASWLLVPGLAVVFAQVLAEEMYFRGWLQPLLTRVTGERVAVPAIAVAFAPLHLFAGGAGPLALVNLMLGGLLFGILAARGCGIAGAVGAHFAYNAAEQLLFGLDPNPGVGGFGALLDFDLVGVSRWGGSAEGLNASWAMTAALMGVLVPVVTRWWRYGELRLGVGASTAYLARG